MTFTKEQADRLKALERAVANREYDDKTLAEIKKLRAAEADYLTDRAANIEKFKLAIKEHGVQFHELAEAFDKAEIGAWGLKNGLSKHMGVAKKTKKPQEPGDFLITIPPEGKGRPSNFTKGVIPQYVGRAFKLLYEADPESFALALQNFYTPLGTAYFETDAGKIELEAFLKHVREGKVNPTILKVAEETAAKKSAKA